MAAIVMFNHNEKAIARQIIESLKEFSSTSPEKGMWWPSLDNMTAWSIGKISATSLVLDAFAAVEPNSPDVDLIRQWLILQKEAKDWGTSVSTSDAIYSILSCGSSWVRESGIPSIKSAKSKQRQLKQIPGWILPHRYFRTAPLKKQSDHNHTRFHSVMGSNIHKIQE